MEDSPLLGPTAASVSTIHNAPEKLSVGGSELDLKPESLQVFRMLRLWYSPLEYRQADSVSIRCRLGGETAFQLLRSFPQPSK